LSRLGLFIDHDLDYERIKRAGVGSVSEPNSSFAGESEGAFNPVARWKTKMTPQQIASLEELVGDFLVDLGYGALQEASHGTTLHAARMRATYLPMFEAKHQIRMHTPLGRLVRLERIEIEP
jgi:hypothetical protein